MLCCAFQKVVSIYNVKWTCFISWNQVGWLRTKGEFNAKQKGGGGGGGGAGGGAEGGGGGQEEGGVEGGVDRGGVWIHTQLCIKGYRKA